MLYITFVLWIANALFLLKENRKIVILILLGSFSAITSVLYFLLAAPDLSMAEVAISSFTVVFFIICFEKSYLLKKDKNREDSTTKKSLTAMLFPIAFISIMFFVFISNVPDTIVNDYLARLYIIHFEQLVGGDNALTAIYLSFRILDTLLEALILVIAIVAVSHLSYYAEDTVKTGNISAVRNSSVVMFTLCLLSPFVLMYGIILLVYGHIGPGGGFQGGLLIAMFFVCRYIIYDIYDMPIKKILKLGEYIFVIAIALAIILVFSNITYYLPIDQYSVAYQNMHLTAMNSLIGIKVACGFIILFYRFMAIERK